MKKLALAVCMGIAAAVSVAALAADVTGTWNVDGDVVGNPVTFSCAVKQEGDKLSGKANLQGSEIAVTGSVKEKAVTFEFDSPDQQYHLVFTGTLAEDGKAISGSIAVAGVEGTFKATKQ
jgi:hypothetical protein